MSLRAVASRVMDFRAGAIWDCGRRRAQEDERGRAGRCLRRHHRFHRAVLGDVLLDARGQFAERAVSPMRLPTNLRRQDEFVIRRTQREAARNPRTERSW